MLQLKIKEVASKYGYTLKNVCDMAGYKSLPSFYRQINNPESVNMKTLIRIADVIGCEVKDFFIDGEKTEDPNELTITCDKCGNVIKFKRSDG